MPILPLHHIGVATESIAESALQYELLTGATCSAIEPLPEWGVRVAFVGHIELLEPVGDENLIRRFLSRRGPGLHHLAYRVPDILSRLAAFREVGLELIDEEPRPGVNGNLVAFVHPRSTGGVLWELVQG